jgi:hypothetical protein
MMVMAVMDVISHRLKTKSGPEIGQQFSTITKADFFDGFHLIFASRSGTPPT